MALHKSKPGFGGWKAHYTHNQLVALWCTIGASQQARVSPLARYMSSTRIMLGLVHGCKHFIRNVGLQMPHPNDGYVGQEDIRGNVFRRNGFPSLVVGPNLRIPLFLVM
jgi:hypothetical protein